VGFIPGALHLPIPGTSHCHRLEENAATARMKISADTEDGLLQVFTPGAASGLRYPENHFHAPGDITGTLVTL
jgi:hypothetical protein